MGSKIVSRETFLLPVALQQLLRYPLVGQRAAVRLIVVADRLAIAGGFGNTHTSRHRGAEHSATTRSYILKILENMQERAERLKEAIDRNSPESLTK